MDKLKILRAAARTAFTKALTALDALLWAGEVIEESSLLVAWHVLQDKKAVLDKNTALIQEALLNEEGCTEAMLLAEIDDADKYTTRFLTAKVKVETLLHRDSVQVTTPSPSASPVPVVMSKKMNLPVINLVKFSGNTREWLRFWSQFRKIHQDDQISKEDKFEYLLAAMEPNSRASELIGRFPPTGENYDEALEGLKNRFGRDDLLVEVYVRELLTLVLQNASKGDDKLSLSSLYDQLESHIQALNTLGVTTDKCAAMLFPLVESSLPGEVLRAWQRSGDSRQAGDCKSKLDSLMRFIGEEVESEEKVRIAADGFGFNEEKESEKSKKPKHKVEVTKNVPTATGLLTTNEKVECCIFCDGKHTSSDCEKARKMSLEEKQKLARQKDSCFDCLKRGHGFKFCRSQIKCGWCSKRHVTVMCKALSNRGSDAVSKEAKGESVVTEEKNLASFARVSEVFLMTSRVFMRNGSRERVVRALIDTGSQNSYILDREALSMGYDSEREEEITHSLFGGNRTESQKHKVYKVHVSSLNGDFRCNFDVRSQDKICESIPTVPITPELKALENKSILLSDLLEPEAPISLLIGADVAGKLFTGQRLELDCGLVAVETLLGWTLMGKMNGVTKSGHDTTLTVISMFLHDAEITDLWKLETIGIGDPVQQKS